MFSNTPDITVHGVAISDSGVAQPFGHVEDRLVVSVHPGDHHFSNSSVAYSYIIKRPVGNIANVDFDTYVLKNPASSFSMTGADEIYQDIAQFQDGVFAADLPYLIESQNSNSVAIGGISAVNSSAQDVDNVKNSIDTWGVGRNLFNSDEQLSREEYNQYFGEDIGRCFVAGTLIPLQNDSLSPIESLCVGNVVKSYDSKSNGQYSNLQSGRVTQTFTRENEIVIDFHGTLVTPGHQYLTDGGQFRDLIEILETDGVVINEAGEAVRARTGWPVGSKEDQVIPVGYEGDDGVTRIVAMRAGTVCSRKGSRVFTLAGMMHERGYALAADGRFVGAGGDVVTAHWDWGVPDPKLFAGRHADYRSELEPEDGTALRVSLGAPAMAPSRPHRTAAAVPLAPNRRIRRAGLAV
jgi:hypothetical protein